MLKYDSYLLILNNPGLKIGYSLNIKINFDAPIELHRQKNFFA